MWWQNWKIDRLTYLQIWFFCCCCCCCCFIICLIVVDIVVYYFLYCCCWFSTYWVLGGGEFCLIVDKYEKNVYALCLLNWNKNKILCKILFFYIYLNKNETCEFYDKTRVFIYFLALFKLKTQVSLKYKISWNLWGIFYTLQRKY